MVATPSPQIAAVVLAAGGSHRMGEPKQQLAVDVAGSESLLHHAARCATETRCSPVLVVLGAAAQTLRGELDGLDVEVVENPGWAEGIGGSIRIGIETLARIAPACDGVLVALADQPRIDRVALATLVSAFVDAGLETPAACRYHDGVGAPAVLPRRLFGQLAALEGDRGARAVLADEPVVSLVLPGADDDVDTPADYARIVGRVVTASGS